MNLRTLLICSLSATLAMAAATTLAAEPKESTLRQEFLECDRQASSSMLGFADAARCSTVYEQTLQREFGGDFNRLLAWWQAQQRSRTAASPASPRR